MENITAADGDLDIYNFKVQSVIRSKSQSYPTTMHNFIILESNNILMAEAEKIPCPDCGAENEGRAYCYKCGTYLYQPSYRKAHERIEKQRHIGGG